MIEKFISPGDKLEMKTLNDAILPDGSKGIRVYKSKVYDIHNEDHIEIVMPMEHTKLILLPIDCEYDVCFYAKGGVYRATLKIVDRQKIEGMYILVTELTSNLHKFQRREYYRFNCVVDVKVRELDEEELENMRKGFSKRVDLDKPMVAGTIVDISGGGARFVTRELLVEGKDILMNFNLSIMDFDRPFSLSAKLIYSKKIENRPGFIENRVKFEYINNATREEIIRYIFDEERKNRKNGKGS
jgi:c-di-GMP-binding flagellar brake protein YcgR